MTESQYIDLLIERYKKDWATFTPEVKDGAVKEFQFLLEYSVKKSDKYPEDLRFALVSGKIANVLNTISETKKSDLFDISKKYGVRAINNAPGSEKGYQLLVEVFLLEGKFDTALKFAEMQANLNERVPEFHNLIIYIAKIKKDQKLIDEKMANARKFIPHYEYGLKR